MDPSTLPAGLSEAFAASRRHLWGLCYRMTGSAADADDLVQETFVRAAVRPPARLDLPWRPWLVRVAINLGRDHLRRRRRAEYHGPWLPEPVEPPAWEGEEGGLDTSGRYDLLESVSYAFLVALEELTPQKRAVLILCDVFDYGAAEAAEALDMTAGNVRTTLHRARKQMASYERSRCRLDAGHAARTRTALEAMFVALAAGDVAALEVLLADDVRLVSDGGGEFHAAGVPLLGRARVIKFLVNLLKLRGLPTWFEFRIINGLPAMLAEFQVTKPHEAPRVVQRCEADAEGRVVAIHSILTTRKLSAISWPAPG